MSITGWRVHFTRRELTRPREVTSFIREFGSLFAGLDGWLDERGVPEGQPFLLSPKAEYDVELNRYFSVWLASALARVGPDGTEPDASAPTAVDAEVVFTGTLARTLRRAVRDVFRTAGRPARCGDAQSGQVGRAVTHLRLR
ncbi:hypothetical protein ACFRIB_46860 [Streptomyces mirabilis]|uniref:hypothetical protein n=1 Tax=Streptomyces mirabilis TaxID=68239 RepID=UPI0036CB8741